METFLQWFFDSIGSFVEWLLSLDIVAGFSYLHFIIAGIILSWLIKFIKVGTDLGVDSVNYETRQYRNAENNRDRQLYYKEKLKVYKNKQDGATHYYNSKTGEYKKL